MDRIKYLKWIAEESPTDDEIDNYDSIISRGAERAEKVQLSLRLMMKSTTTIVSLVGAQKGPRRFSCL
uniref:Uncharacterized protein n=1 Tax=Salmonella typhimurium TaxID=90371 RepID=A0A345WZG3_SALTM|nr:hypothetical protein [Salmonella enterica]AXJ99066.1 hypothetical protein [Salmonella enterica subsp. enterica serovar Typhimurium]